ncbi:hypothetical protein AB0N14_26710 [Streptomyces sp. NPDC051104]
MIDRRPQDAERAAEKYLRDTEKVMLGALGNRRSKQSARVS